ncbi:MAG: ribonuclease Z [Deltaproteobacteria bacterium]|nr:ribonuclease Z [Deltaproteobacteria bacterium]
MKTAFQARLVNGRTGDPALFVDICREKRAVLFDCGSLTALSPSEILRLSDVFVSHTHIDHFIGFDQLLRIHLGRGRRVRVFGPPGITACVRGKLAGYTWNLVRYQRLVFEVHELAGEEIQVTEFVCRHRFRRPRQRRRRAQGSIWKDDLIRVRAASLDHRTPSLAYAVTERDFYNVNPVELEAIGLTPGPWLNELKRLVRSGQIDGARVEVDGDARNAQALAGRLLIHSPGRTIGYIADSLGSEANARQAVELLQGADLLYCEAAFLHTDLERATETYHLTARQAGEIARRAGVRRLEVFHFSPKYEGRFDELEREAALAFGAGEPVDQGLQSGAG